MRDDEFFNLTFKTNNLCKLLRLFVFQFQVVVIFLFVFVTEVLQSVCEDNWNIFFSKAVLSILLSKIFIHIRIFLYGVKCCRPTIFKNCTEMYNQFIYCQWIKQHSACHVCSELLSRREEQSIMQHNVILFIFWKCIVLDFSW